MIQTTNDQRGSVEFSERLLAPVMSHDQLSFQELRDAYNFRNVSERRRVFSNLIVSDLKQRDAPTVLDIGCGAGMARDSDWQWAIKPHVHQYWGLEPDPNMVPDEGLFDKTQNALMEDAALKPESIDVAYSWMVMEHVAHPESFCRTLYDALKPGGSYYFSTPNIRHYFTFTARFLKQLRIDEAVLSVIRKQEQLDEYHYPVQYKFNSESQISKIAEKVGFQAPLFAYVEVEGPINYFPGPTKPLFHLLAWKRATFPVADRLLTMIVKMTKPDTAS